MNNKNSPSNDLIDNDGEDWGGHDESPSTKNKIMENF